MRRGFAALFILTMVAVPAWGAKQRGAETKSQEVDLEGVKLVRIPGVRSDSPLRITEWEANDLGTEKSFAIVNIKTKKVVNDRVYKLHPLEGSRSLMLIKGVRDELKVIRVMSGTYLPKNFRHQKNIPGRSYDSTIHTKPTVPNKVSGINIFSKRWGTQRFTLFGKRIAKHR